MLLPSSIVLTVLGRNVLYTCMQCVFQRVQGPLLQNTAGSLVVEVTVRNTVDTFKGMCPTNSDLAAPRVGFGSRENMGSTKL